MNNLLRVPTRFWFGAAAFVVSISLARPHLRFDEWLLVSAAAVVAEKEQESDRLHRLDQTLISDASVARAATNPLKSTQQTIEAHSSAPVDVAETAAALKRINVDWSADAEDAVFEGIFGGVTTDALVSIAKPARIIHRYIPTPKQNIDYLGDEKAENELDSHQSKQKASTCTSLEAGHEAHAASKIGFGRGAIYRPSLAKKQTFSTAVSLVATADLENTAAKTNGGYKVNEGDQEANGKKLNIILQGTGKAERRQQVRESENQQQNQLALTFSVPSETGISQLLCRDQATRQLSEKLQIGDNSLPSNEIQSAGDLSEQPEATDRRYQQHQQERRSVLQARQHRVQGGTGGGGNLQAAQFGNREAETNCNRGVRRNSRKIKKRQQKTTEKFEEGDTESHLRKYEFEKAATSPSEQIAASRAAEQRVSFSFRNTEADKALVPEHIGDRQTSLVHVAAIDWQNKKEKERQKQKKRKENKELQGDASLISFALDDSEQHQQDGEVDAAEKQPVAAESELLDVDNEQHPHLEAAQVQNAASAYKERVQDEKSASAFDGLGLVGRTTQAEKQAVGSNPEEFLHYQSIVQMPDGGALPHHDKQRSVRAETKKRTRNIRKAQSGSTVKNNTLTRIIETGGLQPQFGKAVGKNHAPFEYENARSADCLHMTGQTTEPRQAREAEQQGVSVDALKNNGMKQNVRVEELKKRNEVTAFTIEEADVEGANEKQEYFEHSQKKTRGEKAVSHWEHSRTSENHKQKQNSSRVVNAIIHTHKGSKRNFQGSEQVYSTNAYQHLISNEKQDQTDSSGRTSKLQQDRESAFSTHGREKENKKSNCEVIPTIDGLKLKVEQKVKRKKPLQKGEKHIKRSLEISKGIKEGQKLLQVSESGAPHQKQNEPQDETAKAIETTMKRNVFFRSSEPSTWIKEPQELHAQQQHKRRTDGSEKKGSKRTLKKDTDTRADKGEFKKLESIAAQPDTRKGLEDFVEEISSEKGGSITKDIVLTEAVAKNVARVDPAVEFLQRLAEGLNYKKYMLEQENAKKDEFAPQSGDAYSKDLLLQIGRLTQEKAVPNLQRKSTREKSTSVSQETRADPLQPGTHEAWRALESTVETMANGGDSEDVHMKEFSENYKRLEPGSASPEALDNIAEEHAVAREVQKNGPKWSEMNMYDRLASGFGGPEEVKKTAQRIALQKKLEKPDGVFVQENHRKAPPGIASKPKYGESPLRDVAPAVLPNVTEVLAGEQGVRVTAVDACSRDIIDKFEQLKAEVATLEKRAEKKDTTKKLAENDNSINPNGVSRQVASGIESLEKVGKLPETNAAAESPLQLDENSESADALAKSTEAITSREFQNSTKRFFAEGKAVQASEKQLKQKSKRAKEGEKVQVNSRNSAAATAFPSQAASVHKPGMYVEEMATTASSVAAAAAAAGATPLTDLRLVRDVSDLAPDRRRKDSISMAVVEEADEDLKRKRRREKGDKGRKIGIDTGEEETAEEEGKATEEVEETVEAVKTRTDLRNQLERWFEKAHHAIDKRERMRDDGAKREQLKMTMGVPRSTQRVSKEIEIARHTGFSQAIRQAKAANGRGAAAEEKQQEAALKEDQRQRQREGWKLGLLVAPTVTSSTARVKQTQLAFAEEVEHVLHHDEPFTFQDIHADWLGVRDWPHFKSLIRTISRAVQTSYSDNTSVGGSTRKPLYLRKEKEQHLLPLVHLDDGCFERDIRYSPGSEFYALWRGVPTPTHCQILCRLAGPECAFFTFLRSYMLPLAHQGACFLLRNDEPKVAIPRRRFFTTVSGPRSCSARTERELPSDYLSVSRQTGCSSSPAVCDALNLPSPLGARFGGFCSASSEGFCANLANGVPCCTACNNTPDNLCPEMKCYEYDVDYVDGEELRFIQAGVANRGVCESYCRATSGCTHYFYFSTRYLPRTLRGSCSLRRFDHPPRERVSVGGLNIEANKEEGVSVATFAPLECEYPSTTTTTTNAPAREEVHIQEPLSCARTNVKYWGYDLASLKGCASAASCQKFCQDLDSCQGFTFVEKQKKCSLKWSTDLETQTEGHISGPRCCDPKQMTVEKNVDPEENFAAPPGSDIPCPDPRVASCLHPGQDFYGHDAHVKRGIFSAYKCYQLCKLHPECGVWTFIPTEKLCFLKVPDMPSTLNPDKVKDWVLQQCKPYGGTITGFADCEPFYGASAEKLGVAPRTNESEKVME